MDFQATLPADGGAPLTSDSSAEWSGSEHGDAEAGAETQQPRFKTEEERHAFWETAFRLKFLKPSFDNTPGLRSALRLHAAERASLYGVYILDVRYAFGDVDSCVSKAALVLGRAFATRHVHVLENENHDSCLESFLGISISQIASFPAAYVVAPTGVFAYTGSVSTPAGRDAAARNIKVAFAAPP